MFKKMEGVIGFELDKDEKGNNTGTGTIKVTDFGKALEVKGKIGSSPMKSNEGKCLIVSLSSGKKEGKYQFEDYKQTQESRDQIKVEHSEQDNDKNDHKMDNK